MATRRGIARLHHLGPQRSLVTAVGLAAFVVGVYVVVVRGGGVLIGRTDSPSVLLSVVATTMVALLFPQVQAGLERLAGRLEGRASATPYDVLRRFSGPTPADGASEELPARMARLLAQGTGAEWAQLWLMTAGQLTLAATWPPERDLDQTARTPPASLEEDDEDQLSLAVEHAGDVLGVLRVQQRPGLSLSLMEQRLFTALADRAGLMLRLEGVRAELQHRRVELAQRAQELQESRERLIETQDAERRRLERDLHDGAQQHLVALAVNLGLAQTLVSTSPERAHELLREQARAARAAIETLSLLSRGIYPVRLSKDGLESALRFAVAISPIPVSVTADQGDRLPAAVESALYFCCMEAVQNAAKHSGARTVTVRLSQHSGEARLVVTDDGAGFRRVPDQPGGAGLANMRDRLDAVGGTVTVTSTAGAGTTVCAAVAHATD